MAQPGDELVSPRDGVRLRYEETAATTGRLVMRWTIPPRARLVPTPHIHRGVGETWELETGRAHYWLGRRRYTRSAPHSFAIPSDTSHIHPSNAGDGTLVAVQTVATDDPSVPAGVERWFECMLALLQQGRADRFWNTRNPLQGVLLIHTHLVPGSYLAGLPVGLQDRVLGAGARAARALGLPDTIEPERTRAPA